MKSTTNSSNNLSVNQVRNFRHSQGQVQRIIENNKVIRNIPELKMKLAYVAKKPVENIGEREKTKLFIKNMVSICCNMVVKSVLENLRLNYSTVAFGEVEIIGNLSEAKHEQLKSDLLKYGLELIEDEKIILIEKIKIVIIEMIYYSDELPNTKFSYYISKKLNHRYAYLSNLFSAVEGMSIQHFIILSKIERVKELLIYDELTLSEIAWKVHYCNVGHLSNQFKKITGLTPTQFKKITGLTPTQFKNLRA